ncbi:hypothetical protein [Bacteroides acidifaciens]|nr:hypothetical protein [Bacteroides acidifaciens]
MSFAPWGEENYPVLERLTPLSDKQITNKLDVDGKQPYFVYGTRR